MKINPTRRRCADCGREGERGFTHSVRGVYICANQNACKRRREMPLWKIRELNNARKN
ncbi:hypothetical protein 32HC_6 [Mycobacterium phage 32HC]|uniref:Uncharacterized protein n=1 Tax=Mycobacterium phage 32HC TaxID=1445729 RepID=W8E8Q2_9CAUD|nr:hypothetical protein ST32HC_6 [Mycobacterium phage 32HC]AHJ86284.1 hypothetical protein 32HC_6 [Mycobacterium phage 32HC]